MSPRAAARLESFGFSDVFDYSNGKRDWTAHGLLTEGKNAGVARAKDAMRPDVPTCGPGETIGEAAKLVPEDRRNSCVIVNERGIVLGRLRRKAYRAGASTPVDEVMQPGPATFRPDVPLAELVPRMQQRQVGSVVITTSDGEFLGLLFRRQAERVLHEREHGKGLSRKGA